MRSNARWIAFVLAGALVASAAVAYALIRLTTPASGSGLQQDVYSTSEPAQATVVPELSSPPATFLSDPVAGPAPTKIAPVTSSAPSGTQSTPDDPRQTSTMRGNGTTTTASTLAGSGVELPAAWSGRATLRITVLGACGAGLTATDTTNADLALNLPTNPVATDSDAPSGAQETTSGPATSAGSHSPNAELPGTEPPRSKQSGNSGTPAATAAPTREVASSGSPGSSSSPAPADPADLTATDAPPLTLGINTSHTPALSVYSSVTDSAGGRHHVWTVRLTPSGERTYINATLTNPEDPTTSVNLLSDAITTQQPCDSHGTVDLPRPLAAGARITGWVDQTSAELTLSAITSDGERTVDVAITATRNT